MADAAGINTTGLGGLVRVNMVVGIWTHTLRTWEKDDSEDMGSTMAALDQALDKATRFRLFLPIQMSTRAACQIWISLNPNRRCTPTPKIRCKSKNSASSLFTNRAGWS